MRTRPSGLLASTCPRRATPLHPPGKPAVATSEERSRAQTGLQQQRRSATTSSSHHRRGRVRAVPTGVIVRVLLPRERIDELARRWLCPIGDERSSIAAVAALGVEQPLFEYCDCLDLDQLIRVP
jgi:hypothetical protein